MENFNNKACYPYTYGDKDEQNPKVSDYVVKVAKNQRFQRYMGSVGFAMLTVVSRAQPVTAIPPEYGEAAANIAAGVGQNVPPLGDVGGTVNIGAQAAQGAAHGAGAAGGAQPPLIAPAKPANPPVFYFPQKPVTPALRMTNTALFGGALGIVCINAVWGEPIAIIMCATGLTTMALKIVVL